MVLKLDSRAAVVWRDPFSLQFGIEPVRAVLREVTNAEERMIAALSAGVSRSGLAMIATSAGVGDREVESLLMRVDALLLDPAEPIPRHRVSIVGSGPTVERIANALAIEGVDVVVGAGVPDAECDLGLAVGHYVLDPQSYGYWLRRDLPHLPVVFGDESVTIGPLVEPGVTACLYCLEHYRRDADASWAAIASQLWGRQAESETPLVSIEVAARVARQVLRRLNGATSDSATSVRLDVESGDATNRTWLPHPECGCIGLPNDLSADARSSRAASAGQRGTGTAPGLGLPRTTAAAGARA